MKKSEIVPPVQELSSTHPNARQTARKRKISLHNTDRGHSISSGMAPYLPFRNILSDFSEN